MTDKIRERIRRPIGSAYQFWMAYQQGQRSADHTARQVFEEVVGPLIDHAKACANTMEKMRAVVEAAREDMFGAEANCGKYGGARDCSAWVDRGLRCSDCPVEVWMASTSEALAELDKDNQLERLKFDPELYPELDKDNDSEPVMGSQFPDDYEPDYDR